jgi:hypothetical protein
MKNEKQKGNFTQIPNEELKGTELTLTEKGLWVSLLPYTTSYKIHKETLHKRLGCGTTQLDTAWKGLIKKGYITSKKSYVNGKICWEHRVFKKPYIGKPLVDNQSVENLPTENLPNYKDCSTQHYITKDKLTKNINSTQDTVSQGSADNLKGKSYKELYEMGLDINPNDFINSK